MPSLLHRFGLTALLLLGLLSGGAALAKSAQTPPLFDLHPRAVAAVEGATATFTAHAIGDAIKYQWERQNGGGPWQAIPGATSATYTLLVTSAEHGALFRATASNAAGRKPSNAARLSVQRKPTPPTPSLSITGQPASLTVDEGAPAKFSVSASGTPSPSYQWFRKPAGGSYAPIAQATGASYAISATAMADNGASFYVRVSAGTLSKDSAAATLTVKPKPGQVWTPAGSGILQRAWHSATRLQDGRVLLAGGSGPNGLETYSSAEIYDPASNTYRRTKGNMQAGRSSHAALLMADGRVLLTSGFGPYGSAELSSEIFNPATETFESLGTTLITPRRGAFLFSLPNGKVLIAGGLDGIERTFVNQWGHVNAWNPPLRTTQIFDPASKSAVAGATLLAKGRSAGTSSATVLADGRILFAGGFIYDYRPDTPDPQWQPLRTAEIYNPATGQFSYTGSLPVARLAHQATLLANGKVLLQGGETRPDDNTSYEQDVTSSVLYDPASGTFGAGPAMHFGRREHNLFTLANGKVLVFGGFSAGNVRIETTEIYDPATGAVADSLKLFQYRHQATPLANGRIYFNGGYAADNSYAPNMLY